MSTERAIVSGYVQGVGFRWTVQRLAEQHDVRGSVRNLPDDTVEIIAQGPDLDAFFDALRQNPGSAQIDEIARTPHTGRFSTFQISLG